MDYKGTGSVLDPTRRAAIYWHDGSLMVDAGDGPKPVIAATIIMAVPADGVPGSHGAESVTFGPIVPALEALGYFMVMNPVAAHVAGGIATIARTGNFQGIPILMHPPGPAGGTDTP